MTDAILSYDNRFHATAAKPVLFTDVGTSFDSAQPLTNLGTMQLPRFAAFTGATAELDVQATDGAETPAGVDFTCDVLGLLGLEGWEDGTLVEFLADTAVIAAATWRPVDEFQRHLIVPLPEAVTLDTLTVRISGAGSDSKKIGAVWAGPSLRFELDAAWANDTYDTGVVSVSQGGTPWTFAGQAGDLLPARFRARNIDQSHGLHVPGSTVAAPDPFTTDNATSETGGVYTFTGVGSTLLAEGSFFTAATHYELVVDVTFDAANAGVPAVEIGTGNTFALTPGRNYLVGTPDDGSDTALNIKAATAANFTGTLEIVSIRVATAPTSANAKRVLRTAQATSPVLWIPRPAAGWLPVTATYGLIEPGWSIRHVGGPVHDVAFTVRESI